VWDRIRRHALCCVAVKDVHQLRPSTFCSGLPAARPRGRLMASSTLDRQSSHKSRLTDSAIIPSTRSVSDYRTNNESSPIILRLASSRAITKPRLTDLKSLHCRSNRSKKVCRVFRDIASTVRLHLILSVQSGAGMGEGSTSTRTRTSFNVSLYSSTYKKPVQ